MKLEKEKQYQVTFVQWLDDDDQITQYVKGRYFYRLRNHLGDLGYRVNSVSEITV